MYIMALSIQTKKGRNLRCISLQYNKEDTIEKEKEVYALSMDELMSIYNHGYMRVTSIYHPQPSHQSVRRSPVGIASAL